MLLRLPALLLLLSFLPSSISADDWHSVTVPDAWRKVPTGDLAPVDGFSWYRALVFVPGDWQQDRLRLYVEAMDDARASYINGTRVGATGTFPPRFRSGLGENGQYRVDHELVQAGEYNTVAIRVYQNDPRPNFSVAPPILLNVTKKRAIRMEGTWQYRPGDDDSWATASAEEFGVQPDDGGDTDKLKKQGVYRSVDQVEDIESYVRRRPGDNDPLSPQQAEQRFETPADLDVQLVLSEPQISQPLFMTWDARGRMWVMEYRQYPDVAGVKMLSRDVFLRSVYDKVPEPPPHGAKGRDRISIHEDTDGDGVYDRHKTFVDGLNIATSMAIGRGGVFVTNPPYLLFYPDRNGDDVPDGDPEVLLEGFGLEDSHSVINSLRFGPDGWLYGAQGSTVTAAVKRPGSNAPPIRTMGQQIWRYHPDTRIFEVFAEGGGNTFGCEIDSKGRIFSGHNGGDTRGFHYVQGGYYRKGFGKHGPLSNPYAFGYFNHIKHHSVPRFTHTFVIYEEDVLPSPYHGRLFGVEPLQGQVVMSDVRPFQSSFETEDVSRVLKTDDQWFRPVDIKTGPDGCIYVADMYEQRIDHSSHYAGRIDRSNGRIYRLKPAGRLPRVRPVDQTQLLTELDHPARQRRQTALISIGDRKDPDLVAPLLAKVKNHTGQEALEALWALHQSGGLTDSVALQVLRHSDRFVRLWTVRLLGDDRAVSEELALALRQLAADEPYIEVRKQLASSARRLSAERALPILRELLKYDEDVHDLHQPLLIWWALETHASGDSRDLMLQLVFNDQATWQRPLVQEIILERLMKRYALAGSREELLAAAELLNAAPDQQSVDRLLKGFEEAYQGRSLATIPDPLVNALADSGGGSLALRLRQGQPDAIEEAVQRLSEPKVGVPEKVQYVQIFGDIQRAEFIPVLLQVVKQNHHPELVAAALSALQNFDDLRIGRQVTSQLPQLSDDARTVAETLIASRPVWIKTALNAVDKGELPADTLSETALRKMLLHQDQQIRQQIEKHWGSIEGASTEQMQQEMQRLNSILSSGTGNPKKGKPLYMQNCGKCHQLFGEGGKIGPDLTPFKRDHQERILVNVVNPGLEIREGFENYVAVTSDGRVVNGFLADKDSQVVVLRGVDGQNIILRHDEIEEMQVSKVSIMPEGTLKKLTDQEIRDLFAYLRSSQPVNY